MKTFRKLEEGDLVKVYSTDNDNVYWTLVVESTDFTKLNYGVYETIKFFKNKAYDYLQNIIDLNSLSFFDDAQDESKWTISGLVFDCGDNEINNNNNKTNDMKNSIINIVETLKKRIESDIRKEGLDSNKTINMVLRAYNDYQRDERDGVDYLFNIEKNGDVMNCLMSGLTTKDIAHLYNEWQNNTTKYFFYHPYNHPTPEPIVWENLRELLIDELDTILYSVLAFPWVESYREIYTKYLSDYIVDNLFIN